MDSSAATKAAKVPLAGFTTTGSSTSVLPIFSQHDYVLVGRREALATPFGELVADLTKLLERVHNGKAARNQADGLRNTRP